MHVRTLLATCLLLVGAANADILRLRDGGQVKGTVEEVVVKRDGRTSIYGGSSIVSLTVTKSPEATLVLSGNKTVTVTVTSVRLVTVGGTRTVSGTKVKSLEFSDDGKITEQPRRPKPKPVTSKDDRDLPKGTTEEQKKLHVLNKSIWEDHHEQVETIKGDETRDLKAEYQPKIDKVVEVANKVNSTIQSKFKERERRDNAYREDLRRYNRERSGNKNNNRRRAPTKPKHNDGLEKDQRELASIRSAGIKLKRIIASKMGVVKSDAESRDDRLEQVYYWHKKKITAGETFTEAAMKEKFGRALTLDPNK